MEGLAAAPAQRWKRGLLEGAWQRPRTHRRGRPAGALVKMPRCGQVGVGGNVLLREVRARLQKGVVLRHMLWQKREGADDRVAQIKCA